MRRGDHELAEHYRRILLHAAQVTTVPISETIAEEAAQLRARYNLRTPDAIQLAAASRSGATSFLTNDNRLPALASLKVLVLSQLRTSLPGTPRS
jgi:predicted nucleic acid-binding protein